MKYLLNFLFLTIFSISTVLQAGDAELLAELQASPEEISEFQRLKAEEQKLEQLLIQITPLFGEKLIHEQLIAEHGDQFVQYTLQLNRYRLASQSFWTKLIYHRVKLASTGINFPFEGIKKKFLEFEIAVAEFKLALEAANVASPKTFSTLADAYSNMNSLHRATVRGCTEYMNNFQQKQLSGPARFVARLKSFGFRIINNTMARTMALALKTPWSPFKTLGRMMQRKFAAAGNPVEHNFKEWADQREANKVHIVFAGHGGGDEVAAIAGSMALASKHGVAVLQAPHHFVKTVFPHSPKVALKLADAMAQNYAIISVLKETSPYAGQGVLEPPMNNAFGTALVSGKRVIIIYPEGRINGFGGGQTPVNWMSFKMLRLLKTVVRSVNKDHNTKISGITLSFLSSTLPNQDFGIGVQEGKNFEMTIEQPVSDAFFASISGKNEEKTILAATLMDSFIAARNYAARGTIAGSTTQSNTLSTAVKLITAKINFCRVQRKFIAVSKP